MSTAKKLAARVPDDVLMVAVRDGDENALKTLFRRWEAAVFRYHIGWLRDQFSADEATTNTFADAWELRHRFSRDTPFRPWLFAVARYARLKLCRWRKRELRRRTEGKKSGINREVVRVDRNLQPHELLERAETGNIIDGRIELLLTPRMAEAVRGKLRGNVYHETASEMNISKQAVSQFVIRGLDRLRTDEVLAAMA